MGLDQILHMNSGEGEKSYAKNSDMPMTVILMARPMLEECLSELYFNKLPECLKIADLGCSAGPNTFLVISQAMDILIKASESHKTNLKPPSLQAFLNDLPGNDFNTVFKSWPSFCQNLKKEKGNKFDQCFLAGVPGSFYTKLFPDNSMHLIYSSYSLMWMSEAPKVLNEGNIFLAKTSPPAAYKAYCDQYQSDFTQFLKYRAEELISGGRVFLTLLGRLNKSENVPYNIWEILGLKIHDMVLEGIVEKKKLDSFNLPCFGPTTEELKDLVEKEGSFKVLRVEGVKTNWDIQSKQANPNLDIKGRAAMVATTMRSVIEPILASHFGAEIMDDLFHRYEQDLPNKMEKSAFMNLIISIEKK